MSLSSVHAPGEGEKSAGCVTCQQCRVPPTWLYVIQTFSTILAGVDAGGSNGGVRSKGEEDAKNVVARVTELLERKKDTLYSGRWEAARTATNVSEAGGGYLRCVRGRSEVSFLGIYLTRASLPLSAPIYLRREAAIRQRPYLTSPSRSPTAAALHLAPVAILFSPPSRLPTVLRAPRASALARLTILAGLPRTSCPLSIAITSAILESITVVTYARRQSTGTKCSASSARNGAARLSPDGRASRAHLTMFPAWRGLCDATLLVLRLS